MIAVAALALASPAPATAATAPVPAPAPSHHAPGDPLERFNRHFYRGHEGFDRRFLRPAALGYKHIVPRFLRTALRHVLSNLGEPVVFVNYLLQGKPGKAAETATRFAINSTVGLGGAMDLARSPAIRLPHRPNGFGDTLGFYGVRPGPYLFLPFVGPTDLRDLLGGTADGAVLPIAVGAPFNKTYYQVPRAVVGGLDERAQSDADLRRLFSTAVDPYATLRSVYLQDRAGEIAHLHGRRTAAPPAPTLGEPLADPGNAKTPELSDPLADPAAAPAPPAASAPATPPPPELEDPLTGPAAAPATPAGAGSSPG